ncbi:MAG TPA: hypothetical protein VIY53_21190 [Acidobacteriaceae bacterium]
MKMEMRSFADPGDISRERIILKALSDLDVGDYAVLKSGVAARGRSPSAGRKSAYWFPDRDIKAGDVVVLYTKKGSSGSKPIDEGQTAYFFYWGRDEPLWTDDRSGAVLLEVAGWQFRRPIEPVSE